jgi:hypothetical protein
MQMLSNQEIELFRRDGFLVCKNMFTQSEMQEVSSFIDRLIALPPDKNGAMVYLEDSLKAPSQRIVSRIEKFVEADRSLADFVHSPRLIDALEVLLSDAPILFKEKINFKMPGGSGFAAHQDIQPGWDDYCPYFISVLVTVDESTIANGCLELSAGHHKKGLLGARWEPLTEEQLKGITFVPYEMQPGDVAFFDCFAPHQSKPNLTEKQRRNIYLTFNRKSEGDHRLRYFADKRANYPPDAEREPGKEYVFKV